MKINNINKFINYYRHKKIRYDALNSIIKGLVIILFYFIIIISMEVNAFLLPNYKNILFNILMILSISIIMFTLIKILIHYNSLWNNSTNKILASELIDKIPPKDKLLNALELYSKYNENDPYADLSLKAINDLEAQIDIGYINNITFNIPRKNIFIFFLLMVFLTMSIYNSKNFYDAMLRIQDHNTEYNRPTTFTLNLNHANNNDFVYKDEDFEINVVGKGNIPNTIELKWISNNRIYNSIIYKDEKGYKHQFKQINTELSIWAESFQDALFPFNRYTIRSDTLSVAIKQRPKIKELGIIIDYPDYTQLESTLHDIALRNIDVLKGSNLRIDAKTNKNIKTSTLILNDTVISLNTIHTNINGNIKIDRNDNIELICMDDENNTSIGIKYSIDIKEDYPPFIVINQPINNLKLDENYSIPLNIEFYDDYGINEKWIEYTINKPSYLEQDSTIYKVYLDKNNQDNIFENLIFEWNISSIHLGPGDEIIFWIIASDHNDISGPGIVRSAPIRAYFPSLEELFMELEEAEEVVYEEIEDIIESVDTLKETYNDIKDDILKEEMSWQQEEETKEMLNEIENITEKIETIEKNLESIKNLTAKNNLINETLREKIEKLQEFLKNIMTPELMQSLEELQKSFNEQDLQKALNALNELNFEMDALEEQLDRILDMFQQAMAEQKLDELIKKMETMIKSQNEISKTIDENAQNSNISSMEERQKTELDNLMKTMEETEKILSNLDQEMSEELNNLQNGPLPNDAKMEMEQVIEKSNLGDSSAKQHSNNVEGHITQMLNQTKMIADSYRKKANIKMLSLFMRVIKNLIDMSYEQENINTNTEGISSRKDALIPSITTKEHILLQQYKNIFIQISDLSRKSFHITPNITKTLSSIFTNLLKVIGSLEQNQIHQAKEGQITVLESINKTTFLLLKSMENMQSTGSASGYANYLEQLEKISEGQNVLNQSMSGMMLPTPQGQMMQQGMMEALRQQQQELMNQLKEMLGKLGEGTNEGDGFGKIEDDMEEIIKDLEEKNLTQESIERGQRVHRRLLDYQKALKNRGFEDKWETSEGTRDNLITNQINNKIINNDKELNTLYKTLDEISNNKKLTDDNKKMIQDYLQLLIQTKLNENEK